MPRPARRDPGEPGRRGTTNNSLARALIDDLGSYPAVLAELRRLLTAPAVYSAPASQRQPVSLLVVASICNMPAKSVPVRIPAEMVERIDAIKGEMIPRERYIRHLL